MKRIQHQTDNTVTLEEFLLNMTRKMHLLPEEFCKTISVETLKEYAKEHGWRESRKLIYATCVLWSQTPTGNREIYSQLYMPKKTSHRDYGKQVSDAIYILSLEEGRPCIDILIDLRAIENEAQSL